MNPATLILALSTGGAVMFFLAGWHFAARRRAGEPVAAPAPAVVPAEVFPVSEVTELTEITGAIAQIERLARERGDLVEALQRSEGNLRTKLDETRHLEMRIEALSKMETELDDALDRNRVLSAELADAVRRA